MKLKCILCGSETNRLLKIVDKVGIYECQHCTLGFVDQKKFKKKNLKHIYSYEEYKKIEKVIAKRLDDLTDIIVNSKRKGRVLEVGPGFGLLSSFLLQKGKYNLEVVEPFLIPQYLSKKSYKMHKTDLESFLKKRRKKYDLIIMFDVIEHLKNPLSSLNKLYTLLNKGGVLVIQTPNYRSIMQEFSRKWSWWMTEDHKWFFSPVSLRSILLKTGFMESHLHTYEDWSDFKKNLDGNFTHINNSLFRKLAKALFFLPFIPYYFTFKYLFWKEGKGGLIFSVARKM